MLKTLQTSRLMTYQALDFHEIIKKYDLYIVLLYITYNTVIHKSCYSMFALIIQICIGQNYGSFDYNYAMPYVSFNISVQEFAHRNLIKLASSSSWQLRSELNLTVKQLLFFGSTEVHCAILFQSFNSDGNMYGGYGFGGFGGMGYGGFGGFGY